MLQRSIHGAARRRQTCNATAMVLHRIIHGAARRRQSCNAAAMVLQRSIHGAARRRRSFNAASMVLGRSCNRASIEQWSSPERHCCAGASSGCNGAHRRPLVLSWSFPLGLQWRCVEAVTLAAACCNPTLPSILIRRLNRRMISLRNHPADL